MRIYITDLAAYNNGHLVGAWYQLPMSNVLLAEGIENILQEGKKVCRDISEHEEYFITDYECDYMEINEYSNITKLNMIAETMKEINEDDTKIIKFLLDNHIVSDILEAIEQKDDVRVYEDQTMEDIAYNFIEECCNLDNIPFIISNNIDYASIARDMEIEGSYFKVGHDIYEYIG